MKTKYHLTQFDLFFLSYDEPNAEENWADLVEKAPWAKRVHGVKGLDAAHRECGKQSDTKWLITVDADNKVFPEFFDQIIELDENTDSNKSFTWNAVNAINGLMYGNGGVKLWSKEFVSNMSCHELGGNQNVDFCWSPDYYNMGSVFSEVHNNTTPYQAFRVGYREGVKLPLDRGMVVPPRAINSVVHPVNLRNLKIWSSVGSHVKNGKWAMLGTRLGLLSHLDADFDLGNINDYQWFDALWEKLNFGEDTDIDHLLVTTKNRIFEEFHIDVANLGESDSLFFSETYKLRNE